MDMATFISCLTCPEVLVLSQQLPKTQFCKDTYVTERSVVQSNVEIVKGLELEVCQLSDRCPGALFLSRVYHISQHPCEFAAVRGGRHQRKGLVRHQDPDGGHRQTGKKVQDWWCL